MLAAHPWLFIRVRMVTIEVRGRLVALTGEAMRMQEISGSTHAVERIGEALRARGILAEQWPTPYVHIADGT